MNLTPLGPYPAGRCPDGADFGTDEGLPDNSVRIHPEEAVSNARALGIPQNTVLAVCVLDQTKPPAPVWRGTQIGGMEKRRALRGGWVKWTKMAAA